MHTTLRVQEAGILRTWRRVFELLTQYFLKDVDRDIPALLLEVLLDGQDPLAHRLQ
jgi:hypothetical protein